jgi:xylulokinase
LNWLSGVTGQSAEALTAALGSELRAPGGVTFLPYLGGERTPHNDAALRGAFLGLGHASDRSALTQAVLEGVAFAFADALASLEAAGTRLEGVWAIGGGSRSDYWLKVIATALGLPLWVSADGDYGAAFGAARLGLIAAEGADPRVICSAPAAAKVIEPDPAQSAAFAEALKRFRAAGPRTGGGAGA